MYFSTEKSISVFRLPSPKLPKLPKLTLPLAVRWPTPLQITCCKENLGAFELKADAGAEQGNQVLGQPPFRFNTWRGHRKPRSKSGRGPNFELDLPSAHPNPTEYGHPCGTCTSKSHSSSSQPPLPLPPIRRNATAPASNRAKNGQAYLQATV